MPVKSNGKSTNRVEGVLEQKVVHIQPLRQDGVVFRLVGTAPYVQNRFSQKAKEQMRQSQVEGSTPKRGKKRDPKDFEALYLGAMYKPVGKEWPCGAIPATQIKAAMVAACRLTDYQMTLAKQCLWVQADGYDDEIVPLIKIVKGFPKPFEQALRVANGNPDIRVRPMWDTGWECEVLIKYDANNFSANDVANLLTRAGCQVGIGEGRPASRNSVGMGWGTFEIQ